MEKIRVLHIIIDTDIGGAERMLEKLIAHTDRERFEPEVLSLMPVMEVGEAIRSMGVPVESAGMRSGIPTLSQLLKVYRWIKERKPAVVQTWMYHADLIGGIAARLAGVPVVWGIHQSNLDPKVNSRNTLLSARLGRALSRVVPRSIVCCSFASEKAHTAFGYHAGIMKVIHNGFEIPSLISPEERYLRDELGIEAGSFVIGMVARFDPQKDHETFIEAARLLYEKQPNVRFILCGEDVSPETPHLKKLIYRKPVHGFDRALHLIGRRADMEQVYAAMDILGTSSVGEGLPLVVGEAMARAIPCVVTDVGDSAYVVGDTGIVVPPKEPGKLAEAWETMVLMPAETLAERGLDARRRVEEVLHIKRAAAAYHALYETIMEDRN